MYKDIKESIDNEILEIAISAARGIPSEPEFKKSGECDLCGEWVDELILGSCEPCCVKYGFLPEGGSLSKDEEYV